MLSHDLRQRIVDAYQRGEGSQRALAKRFAVSPSSVERLLERYRTRGTVDPEAHGGGRQRIVQQAEHALIEAWLQEEPDLTQQEIADRFTAETGRPVSRRTISRVLGRMEHTRKKRA